MCDEKTFFLSFVLPLPTFFFSISPYNISSSRRFTLFPSPSSHSLRNYEWRPNTAPCPPPRRSAILHNIRILIIPVSSVRNVADEYEIAGLQLYVIRTRRVGTEFRGIVGDAAGWRVDGLPEASISVRRVENKFLGVPVSTRCGTLGILVHGRGRGWVGDVRI
jgi:hypothetical protein